MALIRFEDFSLEQTGVLDDSTYLANLSEDSLLKRRENVVPFSASEASCEVIQLIAMVSKVMNFTGPRAAALFMLSQV